MKCLILIFLFFFGFSFSQFCTISSTQTFLFEEWEVEKFVGLYQQNIPLSITFRKGWSGYQTRLRLTTFAESFEIAQSYGINVTSDNTTEFQNSALLILRLDPAADNYVSGSHRSGLSWGVLGTTLLPLLAQRHGLSNTMISMALLGGYYVLPTLGEEQRGSSCTRYAEVVITLSPDLYNRTVNLITLGSSEGLTVVASEISFNESSIPMDYDCEDEVVAQAFPATCFPVEFSQSELQTAPKLLLHNVFIYYNPTQYPHQKCALKRFEDDLGDRPEFQTFSCQFRNQPPQPGSYCGDPILLENVATFYQPSTNPHQKVAVDNLQIALETEIGPWQRLIANWRAEQVCVRNDGRCGPNYDYAGCNPERNYCCSPFGWCGDTDNHCNGGTDYRNGVPPPPTPTSAPTVTIKGPACSGNHPLTGKPGVCIESSQCTSVGGQTQVGLCPTFGPSILCCAGNNLILEFESDSRLCGDYVGKQIYRIEGNGGIIYDVVKILPSHLTDPNVYNFPPTSRDNTMEVRTACAWENLRRAAWNAGVYIKITSGFRTVARQQYFYNCYITGSCNGGNLAAFPGTSNHGRGIALDVNTNCGRQTGNRPNCGSSSVYQWLFNHAQKYGFVRTVQSEPWHWEYRPGTPRAWYS